MYWCVASALLLFGCSNSTTIEVQVSGPALTLTSASVAVSAAGKAGQVSLGSFPFAAVFVMDDVQTDVRIAVEAKLTNGSTLVAQRDLLSAPHHRTPVDIVLEDSPGDGLTSSDDGFASPGDGLDAAASGSDGGVALDGAIHDLAYPLDSGSLPGCIAGALFCDDFETGDISRWPTHLTQSGNSSLVVDSIRPHRGTHALHGAVTGSSPAVYGVNYLSHTIPAVTSGTLSIRGYVYLPGATVGKYVAVLGLEGPQQNIGYYAQLANLNGVDEVWEIVAQNSTGKETTTTAATGAWLCVELSVSVGSAGAVQLFVNDSLLTSVSEQTNPAGTGYTNVVAGMSEYAGNQTMQLFLDDVVVASGHIGCQ